MRGKIFFIAIIIVIILLLWQYLPAITIFGTQLTPGHKESQHEKYDDAGEGDIQEGYDSDGDGLLDTEEDSNNNGVFDLILDETDKLDPDSDDDGLKDGEEYQWWENRHTQQENSENIPAWLKLRHPELSEAQLYELYKPKGDLDRDGLVNILDIDSDNDGLLDGYEVNFLNTDPANPDSDFDGVLDSGDLRPLENIDSDLDGLADDWEQRYFGHLNFTGADNSDNDEYSNIEEYEMGLNPTLVDGSGGQLTLPNLSYEQFYKNDLDQRIFQVSSADFPKYWRMTAFDSYNGLKWDKSNVSLKSYQSSEIPEVTKYLTSSSRTYDIQFYGAYSGYMPTALHTTNMFNLIPDTSSLSYFEGSLPEVYLDSEGGFVINDNVRGYSVVNIDYTYSKAMLDSAVASTDERFNNYLSIPDNLRSNKTFNDLAKNIAKNTNKDFDKVLEIIDFLKNNYTYNLSYNNDNKDSGTGLGHDPIYRFLFDTKAGFCVHFASACVLLCRQNNIPARIVTGFALGETESVGSNSSSSNEPSRLIREGHKHAWVEVRFDEIGWIPFEATAYNSGAFGGTGVDSMGTDSGVYTTTGWGGDGGGTLIGINLTDQNSTELDDDNDGLNNTEELELGTDPNNPDTDGDELNDWDEIKIYGTNASNNDTDGDSLTDWDEIYLYETDPLKADSDGDSISDNIEIKEAEEGSL